MTDGIALTVWGAGGSAPVCHANRAVYGGDTACFEFQAAGRDGPSLILDLGSGARRLGLALRSRPLPRRIDVLLSHLHLDHIMGLPFFKPLYLPGVAVHLHCGVLSDAAEVQSALNSFVAPPFFPVTPCARENVIVHHFAPDRPFDLTGFRVIPIATHHPGGCFGFRLEANGAAVVVIGDHEHGEAAIDEAIVRAASGADLMLYDGAFDAAEYEGYRGWGHSTWNRGVEVARAAGIPRLLIHHHMPDRSDADLARIDAAIFAAMPGARLARQDMTIDVAAVAAAGWV